MHATLRLIKSVGAATLAAIRHTPPFARLVAAHPRSFRFLARRLDAGPLGLGLTICALISFVFLILFLSTVEDLIAKDPLIQADLRIVSLVQIFRTPPFDNLMLFATYLGNWQIVFAGGTLLVVFLTWSRQWRSIAVLLISLGAGEGLIWIIKTVFARQRPDLVNALVPAHGYSFPSGHAFVAFAFYGFATWLLAERAKGWSLRLLIVFVGSLVIMMIGFSRIYLGVHWPSDVLASFGLGGAWLTATIAALRIARGFSRAERPPIAQKRNVIIVGGLFVLWTGIVAAFYLTHTLVRRDQTTPAVVLISANNFPKDLFDLVPRFSEDIVGALMEPINIILVGSDDDMMKTFGRAGWEPTDRISFATSWHILVAELRNRPYRRAPGLPTFWHGNPNKRGFEKPTAMNSVRERHHLHLWDTPFRIVGDPVWVATVHLDKAAVTAAGVRLPIHEIDPAIDREREFLKADFLQTRCTKRLDEVVITEPMLGHNEIRNPFFTDGKGLVLFLKCD